MSIPKRDDDETFEDGYCERCDDLHWIDDPTACGDPEHCEPMSPCPACNPDGEKD